MALFTVLSESPDGENHRSVTLEAENQKAAEKAVQAQNDAIADQEQVDAYTISKTTKE